MKKILVPTLVICALASCATSSNDLVKNFDVNDRAKFDADFAACEGVAYQHGFTRSGGLLTEPRRKDFLSGCMEQRGWKPAAK